MLRVCACAPVRASVHVCACTRVCARVCVCACACARACARLCACACVCAPVRAPVRASVRPCVRLCARLSTHACVVRVLLEWLDAIRHKQQPNFITLTKTFSPLIIGLEVGINYSTFVLLRALKVRPCSPKILIEVSTVHELEYHAVWFLFGGNRQQ